MTRIARVYKHAATNDKSLDLDPFNRKLALVGIIPNQLFSFSSDKDRRTDSRIRRKNTAQPRRPVRFPAGLRCVFSSDPAVSSSIFVGAEREELIRNDPDKSEFTMDAPCLRDSPDTRMVIECTDISGVAEGGVCVVSEEGRGPGAVPQGNFFHFPPNNNGVL